MAAILPKFLRSSHKWMLATPRRCIHKMPVHCASDTDFAAAKDRVGTLTQDPGNEAKLKMYALFKQGTVGRCNTAKPGVLDFIGKAKWSAWNGLEDLSQDKAKQQYIDTVNELVASESPSPSSSSTGGYENLIVSVDKGVCTIMMNRPHKKNAITTEMYEELITSLEAAGADNNVILAVLTGAGDYYSGGNDLNNFASITPDTMVAASNQGGKLLKRFVSAFIDFPKPLIAAVNGPAIGVPVTTLALCDVVYASDRATFHTPFSSLGQSPEGCSSFLFPKIMGHAKANEVLLFGRKLTAQEAMDRGLVTELLPDATFREELQKKLDVYAKLPRQSLQLSKKLIRGTEREKLHQVNDDECTLLVERWTSDECINAVTNFFSSKSKT